MHRLSLHKTRLLFIAFFLALVIPSSILSFKAHEQLRWQAFLQFQQEAQVLAQQIDAALTTAIEKEEARADTDYTFFVLAGSPEAKFVQRSELSKFPVESDLDGIIGYFQIDGEGLFSSPVLPSSYVQSAVQPLLYGISVEENKQRKKLEQSIWDILKKNKLLNGNVAPSFEEGLASQSIVATGSRVKKSEVESDSTIESEQLDYQHSTDSLLNSGIIDKENRAKEIGAIQGFSKLDKIEQTKKLRREKQLAVDQRLRPNLSKAKRKTARSLAYKSQLATRKDNFYYSEPVTSTSTRSSRKEKNYSPQQSLVEAEQPERRVKQQQIQIKLFESEIEPFKFSLLESGHFVIYRQVWRNNKRVIQGAILSAKQFLDEAIQKVFEQSPLAEITRLNVFYADELIQSIEGIDNRYGSTRKRALQGEVLSVINLSEPFGQFSLVFEVTNMPISAGATFIKLVAGSLLLILILGTYFLYRLALRQSNLVQQQQDFVSSVSHELKTPLTSIRMYGEILKQGWVSDEKKEEYYDYIYSESERLSRLITNVLQISKVSHNALALDLKFVEVGELVSLIKSKIDSQIAQNGFSLDITLAPGMNDVALMVDSDAFVQVIINLVDNAIKYSAKAIKKHIEICFNMAEKNKINVSVRDFGPGISKDQVKHVFDLFYRSGGEMTREVTGTGIGLALVKELVEAMNGKIEVLNHNTGVEFLVKFPSDIG